MKGLSRAHYMPPSPRASAKWDLKGVIRLIVVLLLFGLFIMIVLELTTKPKTPATSEQVWNAIAAQGYEPQDITELYYESDPGFKSVLNKCTSFNKDDIHFEFFDFNNNNSAINVYSQVYQKVSYKYNDPYSIEIEHQMANFTIYLLDSLGKYNVAIYVGNTAVYAYCDSENKLEINRILDAIDYLNP